METNFDVEVVGGGPAGAAAALTLARLGLRVGILESKPAPTWKIGETLAPEARLVLQSLGVWEAFLSEGHLPSYGVLSSWGSNEMVEKDFIFNPHGCGWQLDRARFEAFLQSGAETAGVEIWRSAPVSRIQRQGDGWLCDAGQRRARARWLIDASGRASMVSRHLGQQRQALDQLVSVHAIATAPANSDEDSRTLIEARPGGWWYSALMPGGRRTVAWQTDADLLAKDWREPAWFAQQILQTHWLRELLATHQFSFADAPRLTSAQSARIIPNFGDSWIAIGDAAQSYDPLSGQGIFHAMASGHQAAKALTDEWPSGKHAAGYTELLEYAWTRFRRDRKAFYEAERRWSSEAFWQRRISVL